MSKKTIKVKLVEPVIEKSEEDIIADSFSLVRKGILSLDWIKVCDAYEMISGERIEPPIKKKSRLEAIREKLGSSKTTETDDENIISQREDIEIDLRDTLPSGFVESKTEDGRVIISTGESKAEKAFYKKHGTVSPRGEKRKTEVENLKRPAGGELGTDLTNRSR